MFGTVSSYFSRSWLSGTYDDDWIDRVNHVWTVALLGLFAVTITSGQYVVGEPIQCWTPAEFRKQLVYYTKSTCWLSNTYYIPESDDIPENIEERQDSEMSYYQWVPIILIFQAFLFKVPNIAWRLINGHSGIKIDQICMLADDSLLSSPDDRMKKISLMATYIHQWICIQQDYKHNILVQLKYKISNIWCFCIGKRNGTFLTGFYIFIKILYCVNVIGQYFLLNEFMAMNYNNFGFEVVDYYTKHGEWKESPRFPRITWCDFLVRQMDNSQRHTIQCVMPLNLLNEKIFVFEWFWLFILAVLTCSNLLSWLYYVSSQENNVSYIKKHLKICKEITSANDKVLARIFTKDYLRDDGVFILRIIEKNASNMVATDLILDLWKMFRTIHKNSKQVIMITAPEIIETCGHVSL